MFSSKNKLSNIKIPLVFIVISIPCVLLQVNYQNIESTGSDGGREGFM